MITKHVAEDFNQGTMNELHIPPVMRHKDSIIPSYYFNSPHNVNPHPYPYIHNNPSICAQHKDVFLLLMVKTTVAHYARRKTIRETWGAPYNLPNVVMPLVFLLGSTSNHLHDMNQENTIYRDIVQESFVDNYLNSSVKAVMALKWARTFCPHAQYVLIANDDVVVDVFKLIPYLEALQPKHDPHQFALCYLYPCCMLANLYDNATSPKFKSKKRVRLKFEELERAYHGKAYPAHCSGSAMVAPSQSIHNLFLMSMDTPSFVPPEPWIGVLAEKLGITFKDTFSSFVGIPAESNLLKHFANKYLETPTIVAVVGPSYTHKETDKMRRIWGLILSQHRDKPPMDVHSYMGIKRENDNHIYTVAAAALLIDVLVISIIGYIIFCRKKLRPYLQHHVIYR